MRKNKHGFIGVYFAPWHRTGRYRARIRVDDETIEQYGFATAEAAARAFDALAIQHRGARARLNFPGEHHAG